MCGLKCFSSEEARKITLLGMNKRSQNAVNFLPHIEPNYWEN